MRQILPSVIALAVLLPLASVTMAATGAGGPTHFKHKAARPHGARHWRGYGFLPGYRPPEEIAAEREFHDFRSGRFYAVPWPRFYRGRWNGGGFGPCYTYTPIGPIWNCGK
jgi:hypothetical protein